MICERVLVCACCVCLCASVCVRWGENRVGWERSKHGHKTPSHFSLTPSLQWYILIERLLVLCKSMYPLKNQNLIPLKKKTLKVVLVSRIGYGRGVRSCSLDHLKELVSLLSLEWNHCLDLFFVMSFSFFLPFFFKSICLFIYGCAGSSFLCEGFL